MPFELRDLTMNVVAIENQTDRFIFIYDLSPESYAELPVVLGRFASDPELSLTWLEAGYVGAKAKELQRKTIAASEFRQDRSILG